MTYFVIDQMPEGAKCDFDSAQIHDGETCGWKIPQHHSNHMSENPQYISNMKGKKTGDNRDLAVLDSPQ